MEILTLPALAPGAIPPRAVVALGCFDGVHVAHAAVLREAAGVAAARGLPLLVFTFRGDDAPKSGPLLTEDADRAALLAAQGASLVALGRFSALSSLTPEAFVRDVLVDRLHAVACVTGEDFRFGRGATGDAALLGHLMRATGGEVRVVPPILDGGEKISSSRIREALRTGDCRTAARLLGRPYTVTHTVLHGRRLGHTLGFPTANGVPSPRRALPAAGVYVTLVTLPDGRRLRGVTDVGTRPTVEGRELRIETHILGYSGDLYGKTLTVAFLDRLRGERQFPSLSALAEQIEKDRKEVLSWTAPNGHN